MTFSHGQDRLRAIQLGISFDSDDNDVNNDDQRYRHSILCLAYIILASIIDRRHKGETRPHVCLDSLLRD